jgi:hypothetical protein
MVDGIAAMRERSGMPRIATLALLAALGVLALERPAAAAPASTETRAQGLTDAPAETRPRRARPQIRVTPRPVYPRRGFSTPYPLPYDVEYPGPNAKRACVAKLVQEARPSGTVIVPRMWCWWVRG